MECPLTERERITRTLRGQETDRWPWSTRLDIWHTAVTRQGKLPAELAGMSLMDIHRHLGIGRQSYARLTRMRLHGVDVRVEFEGRVISQERAPAMDFPAPRALVPPETPGDTVVIFDTPAGQARLRFRTNEILIREAAAPYLMEHVIKDDDDFRAVKWMLQHAEMEPAYDDFEAAEAEIGDYGFTLGLIGRVPFQQIVLDYMGEERAFYFMIDDRSGFQYLMEALGEHARRALEIGLASPALLVEFGDNFDGMITSPRLFREHCIPFLQEAADRVHAAGRRLGSHMDGNMEPLIDLVPQCGVDVVESFSPAPLTPLSFAEAWRAWQGKVLMWGAIPSPIFESHVSDEEFRSWLDEMFETLAGDRRIILGIGDQALGSTLTERIRQVSDLLESQRG